MDDDAITKLEDLELAVGRVEEAIKQVEEAVKNKFAVLSFVIFGAVLILVWDGLEDMWHSHWRYSAAYGLPTSNIEIAPKPHDCSFLEAPIGEKYCHYERTVMFVRWGENENGYPRISYDDGKTWGPYTRTDPNGLSDGRRRKTRSWSLAGVGSWQPWSPLLNVCNRMR
jgi:hypothetical protein